MLNKFKLLGIVALLATALFMTSCSKENMLEGAWNCTSLTVDGETQSGGQWIFSDGGSFTMNMGESLSGNWSLSGDNLTINVSQSSNGWSESITMNLTVTELKSKSLKVNGTCNSRYTESGYGSGSYSYSLNGSFTK